MLKVGIIGCGSILPMHAVSIKHIEGAKLTAVCDIKKDRADAAAKKYCANAYYDYEELFAKEKLDIVHICLPHYLHNIVTDYALSRGVNVLCEKPMSIKYEDGVNSVALAEKNNLKYGVIYQCRYNASAKLVKKNITSGKLGKVLSARAVLTWHKPDDYYKLSDWKGTWDKEGGGVIIDQAIHSLDLANWFIDDEIESVQAQLSNRNHEIMEVDDCGEGFIKYKNGATLGFWAMNNYAVDEPIEIRLVCENGKAALGYEYADIFFNDNTMLSTKQVVDSDIIYDGGKDYWGFQHIEQIKDFYKSVLNNTEPAISGKEALKIQKLVSEIYRVGKFIKL